MLAHGGRPHGLGASPRRARLPALALAAILGAALGLCSCGGSGDGAVGVVAPPVQLLLAPVQPDRPPASAIAIPFVPAGTKRTDVGQGNHAAAIFRRRGQRLAGPVVVFLHGWAAVDPSRYGPWIGHLARRGVTVVYPAYQTRSSVHTASLLANVAAAVRLALARFPAPAGRFVVAGHSAGATLAIDLAATAASAGLPVPAAVMSAYPGRKIRDVPHPIPAADAVLIPATTRMLILFGERDRSVGSATARAAAAAAINARVTLAMVTDDRVDDHSAPRRDDRAARATFWEALDRLVAQTRH